MLSNVHRVGIVVQRGDADVFHANGRRDLVDRIARDFELVARIGTGFVHAVLGLRKKWFIRLIHRVGAMTMIRQIAKNMVDCTPGPSQWTVPRSTLQPERAMALMA